MDLIDLTQQSRHRSATMNLISDQEGRIIGYGPCSMSRIHIRMGSVNDPGIGFNLPHTSDEFEVTVHPGATFQDRLIV
ncbi:hypothetical protein AA0535_1601 [Asaia krungthepensis NRIC 0535]|uniref:Uncharacterized protein n=1 Tax=Asaia krungthepensis NRIC 0535 TaxID=1307925 RepID=A0ABQ0Q2U7_9PROT|nr:hypothetical protein AA0535_1601 [Asaia krungthepensis NRIC 0535]